MPTHARHALLLIVFAMAAVTHAAVTSIDAIGVASVHSDNRAVPEAHGWIVLPKPGDDGYVLVHLPPRHATTHGGRAGVARRARSLAYRPAALAADGRRVFLIFDGTPRTLLSLEAAPTPVDGIWREIPGDRLTPHEPLPPGGVVIGAAVAAGRPTVLLEKLGGIGLVTLDQGVWTDIEPPEAADGGRWSLFGDRTGPILLRADREKTTVWRRGASGWQRSTLPTPPDSTPVGLFRGHPVFLATDQSDPGRFSLLISGPSGMDTITTIERPAFAGNPGIGVAVLPDWSGRIALLWAEPTDREGHPAHAIREVSLSTGLVFYEGPVEQIMPVSAEEFRLLAITLVLVLVVSLFVVLRPIQGRDAINLPAGWALATPGRRFVATAIDVLVCALPVSKAMGVPLQKILTAGVLLDASDAWVAIPAIFAAGLVYGTITEALFAGTIGKLLVGCRVIGVGQVPDAEPRPLGFLACFTRNLIKWILPPVAALAALEPSGRHRGDLIARAVVAVPIEPPEEGSPNSRG